jgi:glycosyltransferase involved in cell wall biosynthesis
VPTRPLHVVLDVWDIGGAQPRGVVNHKRQYAYASTRLAQSGQITLTFAGAAADRQWLQQTGLLDRATFRTFRLPGRLQRLAADLKGLPWQVMLGDADVYHSFTWYPFRRGHLQVIGTLFDFVPMRVPATVPLNFVAAQVQWCQWAENRPDARWIANSAQTRRDALELARVNVDQVAVVDLCADDDVFHAPEQRVIVDTLAALHITPPFLLCVNTLNPRKNHARLLEAWQHSQLGQQGWQLVLVGHAAGSPLAQQLESESSTGVRWLGYTPREQLVQLYYGCEGLINPSLYEGFGMSVAEAIVAGKPIITSRHSPMAETAADGAILVDPLDTDSLTSGLVQLGTNPLLRRELARVNWARRNDFSLARMAANLMTAYQRLRI